MSVIDVHGPYRTLCDKGRFDEPVAEALIEAMTGMIAPTLGDLATRAHLDQVKTELRAGMQGIKAELDAEILGVRAELLGKMHTTTLAIIGVNLTALAVATGILLKVLSP